MGEGGAPAEPLEKLADVGLELRWEFVALGGGARRAAGPCPGPLSWNVDACHAGTFLIRHPEH
jgi:hypothetical protein